MQIPPVHYDRFFKLSFSTIVVGAVLALSSPVYAMDIKKLTPPPLGRHVDLRVISADVSDVLSDLSQLGGVPIQGIGLPKRKVTDWLIDARLDEAVNRLSGQLGLCTHFDGQKLVVFGDAARSLVRRSQDWHRVARIFRFYYPWSSETSLVVDPVIGVIKVCGDETVQLALQSAVDEAKNDRVVIIRGGVIGH